MAFSLESDLAITCCRAGAIDVWKMTLHSAPRLVSSWSTSGQRNAEASDAARDAASVIFGATAHMNENKDRAPVENEAFLRRAVLNVTDGDIGDSTNSSFSAYGPSTTSPLREQGEEQQKEQQQPLHLFDCTKSYDRAALAAEGMVVDAAGRRALLCLGPRRPRAKANPYAKR